MLILLLLAASVGLIILGQFNPELVEALVLWFCMGCAMAILVFVVVAILMG